MTGDLRRIIEFYHDVVGLELRDAQNQTLPFYSTSAVNEFVDAPPQAEFRAVHLRVPGTSDATDPADQVTLEAFEYRNIDRRQSIPALYSPGVSSLKFLVRDLSRAVSAAKAAGATFITSGKAPLAVPVPLGMAGSARAVMIRDPDGYPVELVELQPTPPSLAPPDSNVLGARSTLVVADIEASLRFYRGFIGEGAIVSPVTTWRRSDGLSRLRDIPDIAYRSAAVSLPGSTIQLELIEFRGIDKPLYWPVFQDIGLGHVAFYTRDIEVVLAQLHKLGARTLSRSGSWTRFSPTMRGFYTRDRDGFFLEVIERR